MSATKEFALDVQLATERVDQTAYEVGVSLSALADLCWQDQDVPLAAPDLQWIDETYTQLKFAMQCLEELRAARESIDYLAV